MGLGGIERLVMTDSKMQCLMIHKSPGSKLLILPTPLGRPLLDPALSPKSYFVRHVCS